jgi:glycosyltransferase involved in cell wall biosynthesis
VSNQSRKRVLVVGSLCNLDVVFAELLLKNNIPATVLRSNVDPKLDLSSLARDPEFFDLDNFIYAENIFDFLAALHRSDILLSITGAVINKYGRLWPLAGILLRKRFLSIGTGSDIAELAVRDNVAARVYRTLLRRSSRILTPPYTGIVRNLIRLGLENKTTFIRYPMFFSRDIAANAKKVVPSRTLRVLHVTSLDWGVVDNAPWRAWTKRNDLFLQGILKALDRGARIECTIAYRGPDRDMAKIMISKSRFGDQFKWIEEVDQHELQDIIAHADLLADQFDVGALGLIALEAMSLGTPVLTYLDDQFISNSYSPEDFPPVINLKDPDDIADFLVNIADEDLPSRGAASRAWAIRNHDLYVADFSNIIKCLA